MDYCTPDDVATVIPRQTLIELTQDGMTMAIDQALPDVVNETVVNDAIRYAVELIDTHLRGLPCR
nr:DUF2190 domain-containing protein [Candidatus Pantoea persica]